jgi:hypothetical protein
MAPLTTITTDPTPWLTAHEARTVASQRIKLTGTLSLVAPRPFAAATAARSYGAEK